MPTPEVVILLKKIVGRLPQSEFSSYDKPLDLIINKLDTNLSTRASEATLQSLLGQLDISLSALRDALKGTGDKTLTDIEVDLSNIFAQLDVALSTRASEITLNGIKTQIDKLQFDANNFLRTVISSDEIGMAKDATLNSILSQLDITLGTLRDALKGAGNRDFTTLETDVESILSKLDVSLSSLRDTLDSRLYNATDALSIYDHLKQIRTQIDTYLNNLDIKISEIKASGAETPRTLSNLYDQLTSILSKLDTTLSNVRDTIDSRLYSIADGLSVYDHLKQIRTQADAHLPNLDTPLSNLASEATLSAIKNALASIGADKLLTTPDNPPNLNVALSTRASESTLSELSGKFPAVTALSDNIPNPTTTLIGSALLGFDGSVWERLRTDGSGRLLIWLG